MGRVVDSWTSLTGGRHADAARGLAWPILAILCLATGAFLKLPEAIETPGSDTGMYATYGHMLLRGARPYVDFWDVHPPLVYAYWALVESIAGPDWSRTCFTVADIAPQSCTGAAAHVLDLLLSVAAALMLAATMRRLAGSIGVAALAAVLVVGFADQSLFSVEGSNPSKLTLLPSCLAVWAYVRSFDSKHAQWWTGLAGIACGVAALAKQPALLTLAALAGHCVWHRDRMRAGALLAGTAALLAAACAVLAWAGSLDAFIAQAWVYNLERILVGYFQHPVKQPNLTLMRVLTEGGAILAVLAAAGTVVLALAPDLPGQRILLWWAGANLVAVLAFREYVYVVPSLAAVGAIGFERAWRWIGRPGAPSAIVGRCLLVVVCVLAIWPTTSFQRVQLSRARFERGPGAGLSHPEKLGNILAHEPSAGALFVYGNAGEMYPLSGRLPATRYLNAEAWRSTAPGADHTRTTLVSSLRANSPAVVVLAPHSDEAELNLASYEPMRAFLQKCYDQKPISSELKDNWRVLTRSDRCRDG